jgi:putative methionine-R-sulfoxide reductase with GAF domain
MELHGPSVTKDNLVETARSLIDDTLPLISNLSNLSRLIYDAIPNVSWAGFYLANEEQNLLYLGPYQGPVACTRIPFEKGVCGTSAREKRAVLVENVHLFPGHIACSGDTNSEVVVPILLDGLVMGVIDLDSTKLNNFNEDDVQTLQTLARMIASLFQEKRWQ